jgi:hypothetical protein
MVAAPEGHSRHRIRADCTYVHSVEQPKDGRPLPARHSAHPVGDMLTVLAAKGSAKSALGIHGLTASLVLLAGMWLGMGRGVSMIHTVSVWLLAAGFGLFNIAGTRATRDEFVAWGYPAWWCWVTGGLEIH